MMPAREPFVPSEVEGSVTRGCLDFARHVRNRVKELDYA